MCVGLILLAAGGSTRLRQPKQLLALGGRSLLRHAAETALASICRPVAVVLGAQAEQMQSELAGLEVIVVNNMEWASGIGSSIRAGMRTLAAPARDGVVIMLCDQPLVSAPLLDQLIATCRAQSAAMAGTEYGGTVGVPAFFTPACFAELSALPDETGAKSLLLRSGAKVARVPFPDAALDIDTKEDYQRLQTL